MKQLLTYFLLFFVVFSAAAQEQLSPLGMNSIQYHKSLKQALAKRTNGNQYFNINFTGAPGTASGLYFSFVFYLGKKKWTVKKVDEWMEVHPTHREYYERTTAVKEMHERTIKQGLASAASAISDYELVSHDFRKYKDIMGYFEEGDDHVLKSMFVDQVDVHTAFRPFQRKAFHHMMRHVFHIEMRLSVRNSACATRRDLVRIDLSGGNDCLAQRVLAACCGQIRTVKGLIPDREIAARAKGIHHRGGKISWARPHGNFHECATRSL